MTSFCGVCPILHRSELPPHSNCASASIEMQRMKGYHGCDLVRLRPETTDLGLAWAEINSLREWPGRGRERCFAEYTKKAPPVNGRASAIQEWGILFSLWCFAFYALTGIMKPASEVSHSLLVCFTGAFPPVTA